MQAFFLRKLGLPFSEKTGTFEVLLDLQILCPVISHIITNYVPFLVLNNTALSLFYMTVLAKHFPKVDQCIVL